MSERQWISRYFSLKKTYGSVTKAVNAAGAYIKRHLGEKVVAILDNPLQLPIKIENLNPPEARVIVSLETGSGIFSHICRIPGVRQDQAIIVVIRRSIDVEGG
jgi:hypothetical protein